jgi:hypothetical protein
MMRKSRHLCVDLLASIKYRTMVDRPNWRPFLRVADGLRAGVHSVAAGRACRSHGERAAPRVVGTRRSGLRPPVFPGRALGGAANYQVGKAFTASASRPDVS